MLKSDKTFRSAMLPPLPERELDPRYQYPCFETINDVYRHREVLVDVLTQGTAIHRAIATRLSRCRKQNRCASGACPICNWRHHRWIAAEAFSFLSGGGFDNPPTFVEATLVLPAVRWTFAESGDFDVRAANRQLGQLLVDSGLGALPAVGVLNFEAHPWHPRFQSGMWIGRWYLLFRNADRDMIVEALERDRSSVVGEGSQVVAETIENGIFDLNFTTGLYKPCSRYNPQYSWGLYYKSNSATLMIHPELEGPLAVLLDPWQFSDRVFLQGGHLSGWSIVPDTSERPRRRMIRQE